MGYKLWAGLDPIIKKKKEQGYSAIEINAKSALKLNVIRTARAYQRKSLQDFDVTCIGGIGPVGNFLKWEGLNWKCAL